MFFRFKVISAASKKGFAVTGLASTKFVLKTAIPDRFYVSGNLSPGLIGQWIFFWRECFGIILAFHNKYPPPFTLRRQNPDMLFFCNVNTYLSSW
jgi:hypothetical protein